MKLKPYKKKDPFAAREAARYANPIPSRELVMEYLNKYEHPAGYEHILAVFELSENEAAAEAMHRRLLAMVRDGQLVKNRRDEYALTANMGLISGIVIRHKEGYGTILCKETGKTVYLPACEMYQLMHRDEVLVRVIRKYKRDWLEGRVDKIIARGTEQLVGHLYEKQGVYFVLPDSKYLNQDIVVPPAEKGQAEAGDIVAVKLLTYPDRGCLATGRVTEIFGQQKTSTIQIESVVRSYNLPYVWSDEVLEEIKQFSEQDMTGECHNTLERRDLRDLNFFTIDGADAKDFDDAVYCEPRSSGGWQLWVAIADVSHYVRSDTELDKAASFRGNSIYFPNKVIPMLPEVLSNDLCSLKPDVDRLSLVCEMQVHLDGTLGEYAFYPAVIRSVARLTYTQVAEIFNRGPTTSQETSLMPYIERLYALYKALYHQHVIRGSVLFEMPEARVTFDDEGHIQHIRPIERTDAERIIEECMLSANMCAADFINVHKVPSLYRVHASPERKKIDMLRIFLKEMDVQLGKKKKKLSSEDYASVLSATQNHPNARVIQTMLLRSMSQAVYVPTVGQHFGLACDAYCHFTSPIRRYPDLIVHRTIYHILSQKEQKKKIPYLYKKSQLMHLGSHCSMTERRADEASREVMSWLKCEYIQDKVDQVYEGVITAVTGFGLFVELTDFLVEGLIHITALTDDYYVFDAMRHRLISRHKKKVYRMGDAMKIRIVRVDLQECQIDFEPVNDEI